MQGGGGGRNWKRQHCSSSSLVDLFALYRKACVLRDTPPPKPRKGTKKKKRKKGGREEAEIGSRAKNRELEEEGLLGTTRIRIQEARLHFLGSPWASVLHAAAADEMLHQISIGEKG